jgi:hypothetical protein
MGLVASLRVMEVDGEEERVLITKNDGKWYGKDRYNLTEDGFLINPTIPEMVKLFEAQGGGAPKKPTAKNTAKKTTGRRKPRATRTSK